MILEANDVTKRFGAVTAVDGLSFHVKAGELYGLVGPDGGGKTTTIRLLAGLVDPDGGRMRVLGRDPRDESAAVREAIGLMPQQYSLYRDLTVSENLRFFARLYGLSKPVFKQRSERLLAITRLERFVDRRADALSGGMYKKLALSCALLHQPRALLLDEPSNGVDPVSRRELWALLYEFVEQGMAILVSTPYMDEAERCSRVGLVHKGRLLLEGQVQTLLSGMSARVFETAAANESVLDGLDGVEAMSPAGPKLRVCVRNDAAVALQARVELRPVAPTFEDLFLSKIKEAS